MRIILTFSVLPWNYISASLFKTNYQQDNNREYKQSNGNPLQYSFLENPTDRGAWWATLHGVAKSQTWLSTLSTNNIPKLHRFWKYQHFLDFIISWSLLNYKMLSLFYRLFLRKSWGNILNFHPQGEYTLHENKDFFNIILCIWPST